MLPLFSIYLILLLHSIFSFLIFNEITFLQSTMFLKFTIETNFPFFISIREFNPAVRSVHLLAAQLNYFSQIEPFADRISDVIDPKLP